MNNNKINHVSLDPIRTINSGQVFLWENHDNSWYGIDGDRILKITIHEKEETEIYDKRKYIYDLENTKIEYNSFPEYKNWNYHFFRLYDDQSIINKVLSKDLVVSNIYKKYNGLRLTRQDPFQCIISFVCASNTNIKRIRYMLKNITRKFGKKVNYDNLSLNLFPTVNELSDASIGELVECGLGYRSKFVKSISNHIKNSLDLNSLKKIEYSEAKLELTKLFGIGNKIADCVLLFSLEKTEAFPIDIWIYRALFQHYEWMFKDNNLIKSNKLPENRYKLIHNKINEYFGNYSGYVQQYLYYDIREDNRRTW
ncbi:MAG TPA: DNA glycosylase [Nitrososphaeraceae archaeon]|nr:DNA glycosylase [Nitrososphaeraceae archaeon]